MFDRGDLIYLSNVDLMKKAGIQVYTQDLTEDGEHFCLRYPFYRGNHQSKNLRQFHGIVNMLDKVHRAGYIHGDIRITNLIFSEDGTNSYLIDYDLARRDKVGCYPFGYYFNQSCHHPAAKQDRQIHDRHRQINMTIFAVDLELSTTPN